MDFQEYQVQAKKTDKQKRNIGEKAIIIPLLGLAGEAGSLLTEYKKRLRDKDAHRLFKEVFKEELGDILWYLSNVATKLGISLDEIANYNLQKIFERWPTHDKNVLYKLFDETYPKNEQLPRKLTVKFEEVMEDKQIKVKISVDGKNLGSKLTDNSYYEDGYRYHDIFHFSYVGMLGWSPVLRKLFEKKRRSNKKIDEVEDGARAIIMEEALIQFVYVHAAEHNFYNKMKLLDSDFLQTIKKMVSNFEVKICSIQQWENTILTSYDIFRKLRKNKGGEVELNLNKRTINYKKNKI
jgi:NTP pyrophosphatase (non-canonical NTP hydrolase)